MGKPISRQALIKAYPKSGGIIALMLLVSLGLFVFGIFLPFTSVTKLWLFENQVSVYRGLIVLWQAKEIFLFLILFVFTVCFPFVKINTMLTLWLYPQLEAEHAQRMYHFVSDLGKWSMLDVFVMAILVLTVKSTGVANIQVGSGFFCFFASVMLTQLASLWTGKLVARFGK